MSFPANPILEAAPYGPRPVLPLVGPQGGPYDVAGPRQTVLLPTAVRTASAQTANQDNYGYSGVLLQLAPTVNPGGAQTLAVQVFGIIVSTGNIFNILTVPASATPGGAWMIYPGLSGAAVEGVSLTRNLVLPSRWGCVVTHSGAGAWTYSLDAILLP